MSGGGQRAWIHYLNHRGELRWRTIRPTSTWYGKTEYYPQPQWLLNAFDEGKKAERTFALANIRQWSNHPPEAGKQE